MNANRWGGKRHRRNRRERIVANRVRRLVRLEESQVRAGDLVICDKLDRWSRDPAFAHTSIRDILKRGASFYAVSDACDPSTPDGDTMLNVRVMIAREEHKRIKERTVGTRNAMRASGLYTDPVPPRGYRIEARRLVVDEEGAAIVRAVFQESILGRSVTRTAKAYGLDRKTVHFILRNRYYLGETRDGRGGWMRGTHEALITPDVWQRARDASESRRLGGVRPRLITSGRRRRGSFGRSRTAGRAAPG
jgi:DNA invertase Pin-like site-specific DNA recombinase